MINIEQYLDQISKEHFDKPYYFEKIKKYRNECGCTLSALFMITAIVAFCIYTFLIPDWNQLSIVKLGLCGLAFIFISAFSGKVIGLGLARIKLNLLYAMLTYKNKQH